VVLLVIGTGLAVGGAAALVPGTATVTIGLTAAGQAARWRTLLSSVMRLRLFFLSLLVLYGWFQPGPPLVPALGGYSPSLSGLIEGGRHAALLIIMVAAVHWLMNVQGSERVIAGLMMLLSPLVRVGVPVQRFTLRLVLAIRLVPELRLRASTAGATNDGTGEGAWRRRARVAGRVFHATVSAADTAPPPSVNVPVLPPPSVWQWLVPAGLVVAFMVAVRGVS